jgi:hypothetical protein
LNTIEDGAEAKPNSLRQSRGGSLLLPAEFPQVVPSIANSSIAAGGSMVQRVSTVAFEGIEARAVDVQVQVAPGLPAFAQAGRQ